MSSIELQSIYCLKCENVDLAHLRRLVDLQRHVSRIPEGAASNPHRDAERLE